MILEVADLRIKPGQQAEFETAIVKGVVEVIAKAEGYLGHKVQRCIETPERYLLMIEWQTFDHHMVTFRNGPLFPQWRAIVGPFFASAPAVTHYEVVA